MVKPDEAQALRPCDLAKVLGVSKGRVSQMTAAGMPKRPDGLIDVEEARAWIAENVDRRAPRQAPLALASEPPPSDGNDYASMRAQHEALKKEITALRLAQESGATVRKDAVQAAIHARARQEREAHENFVVRVAPLLAAELGVPEAAALASLDKHMRQHLEDLARTPLELFDDDDGNRELG